MGEISGNLIHFHEDVEYFEESVFHTARIRGLAPALVEKDYYCSVLKDRDISFEIPVSPAPLRPGMLRSEIPNMVLPKLEDRPVFIFYSLPIGFWVAFKRQYKDKRSVN